MMGKNKYLTKPETVEVKKKETVAHSNPRKEFENPHGCLWGKTGCPGTPIRIVWTLNQPFFFCKCGFDTPSPPKEVNELARGFGLLEKE